MSPSEHGPPNEHDRFQENLERRKATLEAIDGLLENLLIGMKFQLDKNGRFLGSMRPTLEKIVQLGEAIRFKRIKPEIESVQAEIDFFDSIHLKRGVPSEDVDDDEPPADEIPPPPPPPAPPKGKK